MAKIALIGAGIMGAGIARNLLKAGHVLTVYNRTASKTEPLVTAGAASAATPAEAVTGAELIIVVVGDDHSSRQVWLGEHGILTGRPQPRAIAIESTTLSVEWVQELHRVLSSAGLRFIDSPLTGGRTGAEAGELTLLVGAEDSTLAEARPALNAYSQTIIHFGPPGAGAAYKLVVNLMAAVQATALAEGLLLAEKAGLDMAKVVEGLTTGAVASPLVKGYAERMVKAEHDQVNFSTRWMHKDATYALRLANSAGQAMPMSAVAVQLYQLALARGLAEKNQSSIIEALR
jgi:3-hydroxyisobutyrate dehydrogenase